MQVNSADIFSFSENRERTNRLIDNLRVGVLLYGPDSEIVYSNKTAASLLGIPSDQLNGRSASDIHLDILQEDGMVFPLERHPVAIASKTGKRIDNIVMGVLRPATSDRIWLLVNAEPLLDDLGNVQEVICSFSDITERREAEEKLNWLYRDLEARAYELASVNNDLEKFVYVATHDLQEPLRLIGSFVQLLKSKYDKQLDDQAKEYIDYAVEGAKRMKKLILDLLEYSRFSSRGQHALTDMNNLLNEVVTNATELLREVKGKIIVGDLPVIYADTVLIRQLFENLISNSIKYRSESAPLMIEVSCEEDEQQFVFIVKDNGIGIDPGYSEKIFNLFQRLHHTGTYEGTGVGLAICQKIVGIHRGKIWVHSEKGQGSRFCFSIPKTKEGTNEEL
jgi:PAS domain S-box-containing protein